MFEAITKALTQATQTLGDITKEAKAAVTTTEAIGTGVGRVLETANQEVIRIGNLLEGVLPSSAPKKITGSPAPSALEAAAQLKDGRVAMFAANPEGPASGRGPTDWRDRFNRGGYQQEAETAPTASPAP